MALLPASNMGFPPFNMGSQLAGGGASSVVIPLNELIGPPHPPAGTAMFPIIVKEIPGPKGWFPELGWDPALRAQVVLAEFGASHWRTIGDPGPPDDSPDNLVQEIGNLLVGEAILRRQQRMAEIIAQAQDATIYWIDLLNLTPASHPWTSCLLATAQAVGQMVAMHYKYRYMRARPVQVYPAIMPPVLTPSHPSYPNSHALQGLLMSKCVIKACPALTDPLLTLADRVGQNRELAGLHFPSDRDASKTICDAILPLLEAGAEFQTVLTAAKAEWAGLVTHPTTAITSTP
jgi:acid phosphatase (class A)